MKLIFKKCIVFLLFFQFGYSQEYKDNEILKILLSKYYANEKVIVKNRLQLLNFYCQKAPNNEETLEVISKSPLLKKHAAEIKKQINNKLIEDWSNEFNILFTNQNQYLKSKVNNCVSFEEFQALSKKYGENNQRLFIISKPIYFAQKYCLVKVTFYRNIEHNNGSFFLFEKTNNVWILKETLNQWAT
jgi:hypothetical protein